MRVHLAFDMSVSLSASGRSFRNGERIVVPAGTQQQLWLPNGLNICMLTPWHILRYPKQQRLLSLKKAAVAAHALPPAFLPYSELSSLQGSKFDVILIDPPFSSSFTWDDLQELPIPSLAADPSFVLMWVGSGYGEGLERGREIMAKWGFRRCEDIVWVKTNKTSNKGPGVRPTPSFHNCRMPTLAQTDPPTSSLLTRTKQHCLMGIRGTVRRSTDSWFVHCNVGTHTLIACLHRDTSSVLCA